MCLRIIAAGRIDNVMAEVPGSGCDSLRVGAATVLPVPPIPPGRAAGCGMAPFRSYDTEVASAVAF